MVQMLASLPKDLPASIVVIQHMDAEFTPGLIQWLDSKVEIPVRLVRDTTGQEFLRKYWNSPE